MLRHLSCLKGHMSSFNSPQGTEVIWKFMKLLCKSLICRETRQDFEENSICLHTKYILKPKCEDTWLASQETCHLSTHLKVLSTSSNCKPMSSFLMCILVSKSGVEIRIALMKPMRDVL